MLLPQPLHKIRRILILCFFITNFFVKIYFETSLYVGNWPGVTVFFIIQIIYFHCKFFLNWFWPSNEGQTRSNFAIILLVCGWKYLKVLFGFQVFKFLFMSLVFKTFSKKPSKKFLIFFFINICYSKQSKRIITNINGISKNNL